MDMNEVIELTRGDEMRRQFGYISKRCLIAIMTAGMVMSSAAASVAVPMTVCAEVLPDNPEGSETSIDAGDSMENNFGTITNNFGTLTNNAGTLTNNVGTVTNNNGIVANNYGSVTNTEAGSVTINHTGGTVSGGNVTDNYATVNGALTVVNNYASGTVNGSSDCRVGENFGTVNNVASVEHNYGSVTDANVGNNYSSGDVCTELKDSVTIANDHSEIRDSGRVHVTNDGDLYAGPNADKLTQTDPNPTPPSPASGEKNDDAGTPGGSGNPGSGGSGDPGNPPGDPGNPLGAPEDPNPGNPPGMPEDQDPILTIINDALKDYDPNDTTGVSTIDFGNNTSLSSDALKVLIEKQFTGCMYFKDPESGTQYGLYFPGDKLPDDYSLSLEGNLAGPVKIAELLIDYGAGCAAVDKDGENIELVIPEGVFTISVEKDVCRISFGENPVKELVFNGDFKEPIPNPETPEQAQQTHNTVMGAEIGIAALSAGNEFIGAATEGLGQLTNIGADGVSSFASMGGGSMRQETG